MITIILMLVISRYEGNVTDTTKIKFMTDGVLLREVERFSVDKVHIQSSSLTRLTRGLCSLIF